jgi:hypothetical protein
MHMSMHSIYDVVCNIQLLRAAALDRQLWRQVKCLVFLVTQTSCELSFAYPELRSISRVHRYACMTELLHFVIMCICVACLRGFVEACVCHTIVLYAFVNYV